MCTVSYHRKSCKKEDVLNHCQAVCNAWDTLHRVFETLFFNTCSHTQPRPLIQGTEAFDTFHLKLYFDLLSTSALIKAASHFALNVDNIQ